MSTAALPLPHSPLVGTLPAMSPSSASTGLSGQPVTTTTTTTTTWANSSTSKVQGKGKGKGKKKKKKKLAPASRKPCVNMNACNSGTQVVKRATALLGWRSTLKTIDDKTQFFWYDTSSHEQFLSILPSLSHQQSVNKFPGMADTLGKVNIAHLFERYVSLFRADFEQFYPQTWVSPRDDEIIYDYVKKGNGKRTVIFKPDRGSQGDGIYLVKNVNHFRTGHVNPCEAVVQRYLEKPLLIDGYKFDFRVYALLVSIDPVEVYLCREGLARFCTEKYEEPNASNIRKAYMHLTNYSLNKLNADNYVHDTSAISEDGTKRKLSAVFDSLRDMDDDDIDVDEIWDSIRAMVAKTALAISVPLAPRYYNAIGARGLSAGEEGKPSKCFQILGFDVMLDHKGNPWLLEVNGNPSLRIDFEAEVEGKTGVHELLRSPIDEAIKIPVVTEALRIVDARKRRLLAGDTGHTSGASSTSDSEDVLVTDDPSAPEGRDTAADADADTDGDGFEGFVAGSDPIYEQLDLSQYQHLQLLEDCRRLFEVSCGVRNRTEMTRSKWVAFARHAKLVTKERSAASFDLLFITVLRTARCASDMTSGASMGVMEFCDALSRLAQLEYPKESPADALRQLLSYVRGTGLEF